MSDTATLTQPTRAREARTPWVRSFAWDAFWLQSALWLSPLALLLAHGYEDPGESPLDLLVFGLTALFWISHRFGSSWLAYATTAYRPLLRAEPVRFVVVPLAPTAPAGKKPHERAARRVPRGYYLGVLRRGGENIVS